MLGRRNRRLDLGSMSEEHTKAGADRAAEDAAAWFVRLQDEAASGDDWLAFETWLQAAPANAESYDRLERLWVDLDADKAEIRQAMEAPAAAGPTAARRRPAARGRTGAPTRRAWMAAGAALAASVVVGVLVAANWPTPPPPANVYRTAAGEVRTIELADGTHVRLNAASSLSVTLGRDARRVTMAEGEAAFDVAHDPGRPFLIAVGDRQVRVVGTEFNLRRRDGQTALTVRRGVVEVRPAAAPDASPARLTVGQQLLHKDGARTSTVSAVEPDRAFAWTNAQLVYSDAPLSEVAAELSRRFAKPVRIADAQTGRLKFTGVLVLDDEDAVLRRLEAYCGVAAASSATEVVLRRRARGR
jgi:transmembrane sensor